MNVIDPRFVVLKLMCNYFENNNVPYFLGGGALLGIVREKNFLKWDNDLDIDIPYEVFAIKKEDILKYLDENSFNIKKYRARGYNSKICAEKLGVNVDIIPYEKLLNLRCRRMSCYPIGFMVNNSHIEFHDLKISTYSTPEQYLEWFYGDWTAERRGVIKNYVSKKSRTPYLIRSFLYIKSKMAQGVL